MKIITLALVLLFSFTNIAMAQEVDLDESALNAIQKNLAENPELVQKALMAAQTGQDPIAAVNNENFKINIDHSKSDCDAIKMQACQANYACQVKEMNGRLSSFRIIGKGANNTCKAYIKTNDGTSGECNYTSTTLHNVVDVYTKGFVKISDAVAMSSSINKECSFTTPNANGTIQQGKAPVPTVTRLPVTPQNSGRPQSLQGR